MTMPSSFTPVHPPQATGPPPAPLQVPARLPQPIPQQYYPPPMAQPAAPVAVAAAASRLRQPALIIDTPAWVVGVFSAIAGLTLPILGLSARIMHDLYLSCNGLSLAVSIMTWFAVAYVVFTEKMPALRGYYHVFIVIATNLWMTLMWLITMAVVAHKRSQFKYPVTLTNCFNDGSLLNSSTCSIFRRWYVQVLTKKGLAMEVAIACLSALQMILYLVISIWFIKTYFDLRKGVAAPAPTGPGPIEAQASVVAAAYPEKPLATGPAPPVYNMPPAPAPAPAPAPMYQPVPQNPAPYHAPVDHPAPSSPAPMSAVSAVSPAPSAAVLYSPTPPAAAAPPTMSVPSDVSELPSHAQQQMNPPVEMYAEQRNRDQK
ncbi:uncharacterized protein BROUX77_007492 [Berkeleyomyces rouxiae]|uniref:uncharacterized protein n=1 Tax=Berkeleyomyces rouxiae TaxID=2035830 RepID=UPI003B7DFEE9